MNESGRFPLSLSLSSIILYLSLVLPSSFFLSSLSLCDQIRITCCVLDQVCESRDQKRVTSWGTSQIQVWERKRFFIEKFYWWKVTWWEGEDLRREKTRREKLPLSKSWGLGDLFSWFKDCLFSSLSLSHLLVFSYKQVGMRAGRRESLSCFF